MSSIASKKEKNELKEMYNWYLIMVFNIRGWMTRSSIVLRLIASHYILSCGLPFPILPSVLLLSSYYHFPYFPREDNLLTLKWHYKSQESLIRWYLLEFLCRLQFMKLIFVHYLTWYFYIDITYFLLIKCWKDIFYRIIWRPSRKSYSTTIFSNIYLSHFTLFYFHIWAY